MKNKFGFTLVELLIAMSIGMLVVGFGAMALNNFNEKQEVETTKQELLSNLRLARNYAVTNQLSSGGDRVAVSVDADGVVKVTTQNNSNVDVGDSFFSKDITPKRVSIIAPVIRFSVTDGRSIGGALDITIVGDDLIKKIKIDESGLIYEE